jgi:hypothetical protein
VPVFLTGDIGVADVTNGGAEEPALLLVFAERGTWDGDDVAFFDGALGDEPEPGTMLSAWTPTKRAALSRNRT